MNWLMRGKRPTWNRMKWLKESADAEVRPEGWIIACSCFPEITTPDWVDLALPLLRVKEWRSLADFGAGLKHRAGAACRKISGAFKKLERKEGLGSTRGQINICIGRDLASLHNCTKKGRRCCGFILQKCSVHNKTFCKTLYATLKMGLINIRLLRT